MIENDKIAYPFLFISAILACIMLYHRLSNPDMTEVRLFLNHWILAVSFWITFIAFMCFKEK